MTELSNGEKGQRDALDEERAKRRGEGITGWRGLSLRAVSDPWGILQTDSQSPHLRFVPHSCSVGLDIHRFPGEPMGWDDSRERQPGRCWGLLAVSRLLLQGEGRGDVRGSNGSSTSAYLRTVRRSCVADQEAWPAARSRIVTFFAVFGLSLKYVIGEGARDGGRIKDLLSRFQQEIMFRLHFISFGRYVIGRDRKAPTGWYV